MYISVELFFDPQTEATIREMWLKISNNSVSSFMTDIKSTPHISLAVYDCIDLTHLRIRLSEFAISHNLLSLRLSAIGLFPGKEDVLFLAPAVTEGLLAMHRKYHQMTADCSHLVWPYYRPNGVWFPHCTLAMKLNKEDILQAISLIADGFKGIEGKISSVAAVEYSPSNVLFEFPLGIKKL